MKSISKLIRRFIGILLLSSLLLLVFNIVLLLIISKNSMGSGSPWTIAKEVSASLAQTEDGYTLSAPAAQQLQDNDVWGILIDDSTGRVVWHTPALPQEVPLQYNLSDIATLSRGYVKDYPTFTGGYGGSLLVLGFPKTSYWKALYNNWDLSFISNLPKTFLFVVLANISAIFLIYIIANTKLFKSIDPILNGIEALPTETGVHVKETGTLSEVAQYINKTSEILQNKNYKLQQKETARINWIAGVSHDIRTPLSMVMGYAGQLEGDARLPAEAREKASVIIFQSIRIKNLISDLNFASKLEHTLQPTHAQPLNAVSAVRQTVTDFINSDIQNQYPVQWQTDEALVSCRIRGDEALIKRAVMNLLQNAQRHNPKGCTIFVQVKQKDLKCLICIDDNGKGMDDARLKKTKNAPHYMLCDKNAPEQQHGLGLLIVKQIAAAHKGTVNFAHSPHGGFSVVLSIPAE